MALLPFIADRLEYPGQFYFNSAKAGGMHGFSFQDNELTGSSWHVTPPTQTTTWGENVVPIRWLPDDEVEELGLPRARARYDKVFLRSMDDPTIAQVPP